MTVRAQRQSFVSMALALAATLMTGPCASAQCNLAWDRQFGAAGASSEVYAAVVFDDGTGPALYVGGPFTQIGGINANHIARFDGEHWSNVGEAFNSTVEALAVYDDGNGPALYAAGSFTSIGAASIQRFAKWNGSTWSAPPGGTFNQGPNNLYVSDAPTGQPRLYASGPFSTIGGNPVERLVAYDGVSWTSISGAPYSPTTVRVVEFDDPNTPASDLFVSAGVSGIYRFDGTSMVNVAPGGVNNAVYALAAFDDGNGPALYAGGEFSMINGVSAKRIAKWDGSTWSEVGGGLSSPSQHLVRNLCVWDDGNGLALHVGGMFETAGTVAALNIARWSGSAWSALGSGVGPSSSGFPKTRAIVPFDSGAGEGLAIVGDFTTPKQHVAFWNGTVMRGTEGSNGLGVPFTPGTVFDFTVYNDPEHGPLLIAGGNFQNAGPVNAARIAAWNGHGWSALGPGFNGQVLSVATFDGDLYASGNFSTLNGQSTPMRALARWDGAQWSDCVPSGITVAAVGMAIFDDGDGPALYLAGNGTPGFGVVARHDGSLLTQIGSTLNREINCIAVFDDGAGAALYVGTESTATGPAATDSLLKFNGSAWVAVGGGVQKTDNLRAYVRSLLPIVDNGVPKLVVRGDFDTAGGSLASRGVVYWDGTQWSAPPGTQPAAANVRALTLHDDGTGEALFAGFINSASTTFNDNIVKLTATGWEPLAFGLGGGINALESFDNEGGSSLYAGGSIQFCYTTAAQSLPANEYFRTIGIARWFTCLEAPSIISPPGNQSSPPAANVFFDVTADGGDLDYRWRRDGVPLDNNATQTGVDTNQLTLFNVDGNDEGEYDVVVTNAAGDVTSDAGTLTVTKPCVGNIVGGGGGGGAVDVNDLLAVITTWGPCPAPCPPQCTADIAPNPGGNCSVDVNDLLMVITHWGACP